MTVSIIIKAFNEGHNIARTVESCLAALEGIDGEVILADSLSEDRTLEVASRYPISIVQLLNKQDRGCGAAAQLGFQHCAGEYLYLIDGDMVLHQSFLKKALMTLYENPEIAGVGGIVNDMNIVNEEFQLRDRRRKPHLEPGPVGWLAGGGLYRRSAIDSVRYLADRNLHGDEEFELGLRLRSRGWTLVRLNETAVNHYGHTSGGYEMMWYKFKAGYFRGPAEVLRSAIGRSYFWQVCRHMGSIFLLSAFATVWLITLLLVLLTLQLASALALTTIIATAPVAVMSFKHQSLRLGLFSISGWITLIPATLHGFMLPRVDPFKPLESRIVRLACSRASLQNPLLRKPVPQETGT
jgi:glycosyltransferase involved in cell wall biosynthesis